MNASLSTPALLPTTPGPEEGYSQVVKVQLKPVSYTHLDVYKRQVLDMVESPGKSVKGGEWPPS